MNKSSKDPGADNDRIFGARSELNEQSVMGYQIHICGASWNLGSTWYQPAIMATFFEHIDQSI